ncbi:hypothetical protein LSTR_LSTR000412 [Laodelphax striatellus]|uniref:Uncharacterized protein n=1 Tax=Laodelphax striatellus TaxID=195883 RepID=A0A482X479_LAOST|nr:hypothetical protein LSTR_LSTR000412 [Laodelphax striatellus]
MGRRVGGLWVGGLEELGARCEVTITNWGQNVSSSCIVWTETSVLCGHVLRSEQDSVTSVKIAWLVIGIVVVSARL